MVCAPNARRSCRAGSTRRCGRRGRATPWRAEADASTKTKRSRRRARPASGRRTAREAPGVSAEYASSPCTRRAYSARSARTRKASARCAASRCGTPRTTTSAVSGEAPAGGHEGGDEAGRARRAPPRTRRRRRSLTVEEQEARDATEKEAREEAERVRAEKAERAGTADAVASNRLAGSTSAGVGGARNGHRRRGKATGGNTTHVRGCTTDVASQTYYDAKTKKYFDCKTNAWIEPEKPTNAEMATAKKSRSFGKARKKPTGSGCDKRGVCFLRREGIPIPVKTRSTIKTRFAHMLATSQSTQSCTSPPVASTASRAFFAGKPMPTRSVTADAGAAFSPPARRFFLALAGFFSAAASARRLLLLEHLLRGRRRAFRRREHDQTRARSAASSRSLLGRESASTSAGHDVVDAAALGARGAGTSRPCWVLAHVRVRAEVRLLGGSGSTIASTCSSVRPYFASFAARARAARRLILLPWLVMRPFLR